MDKIVVANPPAYIGDKMRHFIQSGSRWSFSMDVCKEKHKFPHYQPYPFNLGYAVAFLKSKDFHVAGLDGCALDMDEKEWCNAIVDMDPSLLYVEIPTISFTLMQPILEYLRGIIKCNIIVVGPHVSSIAHASTFVQLPGEWEKYLGPPEVSFSDYPHPDRTFFPNEQYSNFEFRRPSAQMVTSRGCPGNCTFCVERHVIYRDNCVRMRPIKDVVDEMDELSIMGARQIYFDDMSLTSAKYHVEALCTEIIKRGMDMPWTAMGDMNTSEETIKLMDKAGCLGLAFGVETINPSALKGIGKQWVTPDLARRFTKLLKEYNIYSVATYSLGLPHETVKTLQETVDFAFELDTDSLQFSIATPFPGTPFYNLCDNEGYLRTKIWSMYDGARHSVVDYPQLSHEDIEEAWKGAMARRAIENRGFRK